MEYKDRIEFVKKLLRFNGFEAHKGYSYSRNPVYSKWQSCFFNVRIYSDRIEMHKRGMLDTTTREHTTIPHDQPIKKLRDFIKQSNGK